MSEPKFDCSICFSQLVGLESMRAHLNHHARLAPPCLLCDKTFTRSYDLNKHYTREHSVLRINIDPIINSDKVQNQLLVITAEERVMCAGRNSLASKSTRISEVIIEKNLNKLKERSCQPQTYKEPPQAVKDAKKLRAILIPLPEPKKRTSTQLARPSKQRKLNTSTSADLITNTPMIRVKTAPRRPGHNQVTFAPVKATSEGRSSSTSPLDFVRKDSSATKQESFSNYGLSPDLPDLEEFTSHKEPVITAKDILCATCGITQDIGCSHMSQVATHYGLLSSNPDEMNVTPIPAVLESYSTETSLLDLFKELDAWSVPNV